MAKAVSMDLDFESASNEEGDIMLDITKVETYKEALRTDIIGEAKKALDDYQSIVTTVGQNWNGKAAQDFIDALDSNIEQCKTLLDEVAEGMAATVDLAHDTIVKEDQEMIESGFGVF